MLERYNALLLQTVIKKRKNIGFRFISILLILSVGLWTASKAMYSHAHILPDGKIVYHAHPYKKANDSAPFKQHKHTDAQLVALDSLNHVYLTINSTLVILLAFTFASFFQIKNRLFTRYTHKEAGRSPPYVQIGI